MERIALILIVTTILVAHSVSWTFAITGKEIISVTGVERGLCALVGSNSGTLAAELSNEGKMVVHVLASDEASLKSIRQSILEKRMGGIVSAEAPLKIVELPYAGNLINLLVADLDALGSKAPPQSELLRVLAPRGVAYFQKGGSWSKLTKPFPSDMDEWTHWDYDHTRHALSRDKIVKPPTGLHWMQGPYLGVSRGHGNPLSGYRISDGVAFHTTEVGSSGPWNLVARDAFNGTMFWRKDIDLEQAEKIAYGGKIYTFLKKNEPMVSIDGRTGEIATTFTQGNLFTPVLSSDANYCFASVIVNGILMQGGGNRFNALDAASGALKWTLERQGKAFVFPAASTDGSRMFLPVVSIDKSKYWRFSFVVVQEILCVDSRNGSVLWTNKDFSGLILTQFIYSQGKLVFFAPNSGFGNRDFDDQPSYMGVIDAASGSTSWKKTYDHWGNNCLVRGDVIYNLAYKTYCEYSLKDGALLNKWQADKDGNCAYSRGTDRFLIFSSVSYVDWINGKFQRQFSTRSACATGGFPANGMVYFTPNDCGCFSMLRGHIALSVGPVAAPWPDAIRRQTTATAPLTGSFEPAGSFLPVSFDFSNNEKTAKPLTNEVTAGSVKLVARINEHRIEARGSDNGLLWTFVAGGRISTAPIVVDGMCVFGSHDGWVYALDGKTGVQKWRFLAAPVERKIAVYGQIESAWPVLNVLQMGGLLYCCAGRHPELDGGMYLYGLKTDGSIQWKTHVRKTQPWRESTFRWPAGMANSTGSSPAVNDGLKAESGQLAFSAGKDLSKTAMLIDPNKSVACYLDTDCSPVAQLHGKQQLRATRNYVLELESFTINEAGPVRVSVLGLDGRTIRILYEGDAPAGTTRFKGAWRKLRRGFYLVVLSAGNDTYVRPLERL